MDSPTSTCRTSLTLSILSLPHELLSYISCLAVEPYPERRLRNLCIACVCRHWRNILLNSSEFWWLLFNSINFRGNTAFLALLLERSSPRALEFYSPIQFIPSFTETLSEHWHRIARVDIMVSQRETLIELHELFQSSNMSSLGHLVLTVVMDIATYLACPTLPPLPRTMLPVLYTLDAPFDCLASFSVESLRCIRASSLRSINHRVLHNENIGFNPLNSLHDTLARCPHLETLHITAFQYVVRTPIPTIHLPHLRRLTIEESPEYFENYKLILRTLRIPPTARIETLLDCHHSYLPHQNELSTVLAALSLRPLATNSVRIQLCGMQAFILEVDTVLVRADKYLFTHFSRELVAYFTDAPNTSVTALTLECMAQSFDLPATHVDWPVLLPAFARVVRPVVRGPKVRPLFEALAGGDGGDSGEEGVYGSTSQDDPQPPIPFCPALEEVTYGWNGGDMDDDEGSFLESLRPVVETIVPLLARRTELLAGRRLKHLILECTVGYLIEPGRTTVAISRTETAMQANILTPLRRLVDGPVEYRRGSGMTGWVFLLK